MREVTVSEDGSLHSVKFTRTFNWRDPDELFLRETACGRIGDSGSFGSFSRLSTNPHCIVSLMRSKTRPRLSLSK